MFVQVTFQYTLGCDATDCDETFVGEPQRGKTNVRKDAAEQGWEYQNILIARSRYQYQDLCPVHASAWAHEKHDIRVKRARDRLNHLLAQEKNATPD